MKHLKTISILIISNYLRTCQAPPGGPFPSTRWGMARSGSYRHSSGDVWSNPKSLSGSSSESKSTATGLDDRPSNPSHRYSRSWRESEAERRCQNFLWADEASFTAHVFVWESYLLEQRQVRLLPQLAVQQGVRVRCLRWQVGGVTWQQVWQTDAWGAVTWGNTEGEREVNPVEVSGCCSRAMRLARGSSVICVSAGCYGYSCSDQEVSLLLRRQKTSSKKTTSSPRSCAMKVIVQLQHDSASSTASRQPAWRAKPVTSALWAEAKGKP